MSGQSFLGLDIATATGWSIITDIGGNRFKIRCGTFDCRGVNATDKCVRLARHLARLLNAERKAGTMLAGAAIEEALKFAGSYTKITTEDSLFGQVTTKEEKQKSTPETITTLSKLHGVAVCACVGFRMLPTVVAAPTWRKHFMGVAMAPPRSEKGWIKAKAIKRAESLGAIVNNDNEADAVGVAFYAEKVWREARLNERVAA